MIEIRAITSISRSMSSRWLSPPNYAFWLLWSDLESVRDDLHCRNYGTSARVVC